MGEFLPRMGIKWKMKAVSRHIESKGNELEAAILFRVVRDGALLSASRREMNSEEKPRARSLRCGQGIKKARIARKI